MAEAEGDERWWPTASPRCRAWRKKPSSARSKACSPARPTAATPSSKSMPAPAAPRRRTGRRCWCACTRAGPKQRGFKVEILEEAEGEQAGIKSVTMQITGPNAYGWLKTESGVHRLVRISPFDSAARRHTSFSSRLGLSGGRRHDRDRDQPGRPEGGHLPRLRRRRPAREQDRIARSASPISRPASSSPARPTAPSTATAPRMDMLRARMYEMELQKREAARPPRGRQDRYRLGPPDPLLRAGALPAGEGSAHRLTRPAIPPPCSMAGSTRSWRLPGRARRRHPVRCLGHGRLRKLIGRKASFCEQKEAKKLC